MTHRKVLSRSEKIKIIEFQAREKCSVRKVAVHFKIGKTCAGEIIKNKDEILKRCQDGNDSVRRNFVGPGPGATIDKLVFEWFQWIRYQKIPISGTMLKEKAREVSKELGISDFKASNGWLEKFQNRHSISFKAISGESNADVNVVNGPLPEIVEYKLQQPTVLEKIELTQSILDKSKTAKGPAGAPANTATNRYPGSGRPLEKRLHQEVTENEHDDDRMFMLSLTGKMKHLSPADNMKFRLEVQQLLLNKLCPDVTDNAPSSSSSFTSVLIKEEIQEEPLTDENLASISELKPPPVKIKKEVVDENSSTDMDFN